MERHRCRLCAPSSLQSLFRRPLTSALAAIPVDRFRESHQSRNHQRGVQIARRRDHDDRARQFCPTLRRGTVYRGYEANLETPYQIACRSRSRAGCGCCALTSRGFPPARGARRDGGTPDADVARVERSGRRRTCARAPDLVKYSGILDRPSGIAHARASTQGAVRRQWGSSEEKCRRTIFRSIPTTSPRTIG